MFEEFLGLGGGGGGELQPAPPGTPPEQLTAQWGDFLKNPKTQAALLNFGLEMMKPRWQAGSALPDALGAAVKTYGGAEEEERAQAEARRKEGIALGERAADRSSRLEAARIGADSRADVANIRSQAMLDAVQLRQSLRPGVEQKLFDQARREFISGFKRTWDGNLSNLTKQYPSPEEIARQADEFAMSRVRGLNLGTLFGPGAGGPEINQADTRLNPPPLEGPVGQPGPEKAPKPTSINTPKPTGGLTSREALRKLEIELGQQHGSQAMAKRAEILSNPTYIAALRARVSDPEELDRLLAAHAAKRTTPPLR